MITTPKTIFQHLCLDAGIKARFIGNETYEISCRRSAFTALEIAESHFNRMYRITLERLYTENESKYFITLY